MLSLPAELFVEICQDPAAARSIHRTCTFLRDSTRGIFKLDVRVIVADYPKSGHSYSITGKYHGSNVYIRDSEMFIPGAEPDDHDYPESLFPAHIDMYSGDHTPLDQIVLMKSGESVYFGTLSEIDVYANFGGVIIDQLYTPVGLSYYFEGIDPMSVSDPDGQFIFATVKNIHIPFVEFSIHRTNTPLCMLAGQVIWLKLAHDFTA